MFSRSNYLPAILLLLGLGATRPAAAQGGPAQTTAKKGSLVGSTFQGSDEPMNIQPGWEHIEGVPVPKSKAKVAAYGVDRYERKGDNLFLFVQRMGAKGAKEATWKILDTLYVARPDKGTHVEFCPDCRMNKKPTSEVYITTINKATKTDKQNGYYGSPQVWLVDRTSGKFVLQTSSAVRSYIAQ